MIEVSIINSEENFTWAWVKFRKSEKKKEIYLKALGLNELCVHTLQENGYVIIKQQDPTEPVFRFRFCLVDRF